MLYADLRTIEAAAVTICVTAIPTTTAAVVCVAAIRTTTVAIVRDADAAGVEVTTDATRNSGLNRR